MNGSWKKINIILVLITLLSLSVNAASAQPAATIYVLRVEGPIVPVVAEYIQEGIATAEQHDAAAVIIELSTPGGLLTTTQKIVESILNARVPVIVYVSPAGAWAGSAGTFITLAAHVAAMAPGSRIGAAHPVAMGNEGQLSETQQQKAAEDAAAWIRSIAELRGRDPASAEATVLESKSYSDSEALQLGLVDLQAADRDELISLLEGRIVSLISGKELKLEVAGKQIRELSMSSIQRLLFSVSEPNIAYLLMTIGTLGLILELYHPGAIFPGVAGGISLLLGLYALGSLNAHFSGILLLLLGLGLMAAEVFVVSHGLLATGGIVSFALGSFLLFSKTNPAFLKVSIPLIVVTALLLAAAVALLLRAVIRVQRRQAFSGRESVQGKKGLALTDLNPTGTILFEGERWQAESIEPLPKGATVMITEMEGLKLKVKKWPEA
ncbi:MAG: nodulation protein NfeD [Clostridia bacterium]|nr:nodulation protein NfeD [Clostridia bacterium]